MYKNSKKDKIKKSSFLSDVTLNDFANTSVGNGGGRLRKGTMTKLSAKLKQLSASEDDRAWDEKLDELVPSSDDDNDDDDEDEEAKEKALSKVTSRRKKKQVLEISEDGEGGKMYPMEVWHLISENIKPEDIGTFAGICRTCRAVTKTAAFWFSLYKRYYMPVDKIPEVLRPKRMVRRYGLRSLVIRTLFYTYPKFLSKPPTKTIPLTLLRMRCVDCWSKKLKQNEQWVYTFKLRETSAQEMSGQRSSVAPKPNLYEMLDDVNANVDEHCKVLQVLSTDYCPLPMLIGQVLTSVKLNMSQKFQYYHLHLQFNNGPGPHQSCPVSMDSVINVRVLSWWHSSFPRSDPFDRSLFSPDGIPDCDF